MWFHLSMYFSLYCWILLRKSCLLSVSWSVWGFRFKLRFLIHFSIWFLCRVKDMVLTSFLWMCIYNLASTLCWLSCLCLLFHLCQKQVIHSCVHSFWVHYSTRPFAAIKVCIIVRGPGLWEQWLYSFCFLVLWLYMILYVSIWI